MDHTAAALVPRTIRLALLFHSYSNLSQLDPGFLLSLYCMRLFPSLVWGISSKTSLFKVHAASLLCARVHRKLPRLCAQVPPQIISKTNFHIINILAMIWKHIYIVQICIIHCTNMYQKKNKCGTCGIFQILLSDWRFCHPRYSSMWYEGGAEGLVNSEAPKWPQPDRWWNRL